MEYTNKMKNLTSDLKAFEQLMNRNRIREHNPEAEYMVKTDLEKEDLRDPSEILDDVSLMLMEMAFELGKAIMRVKYLEDQYYGEEAQEEDPCDECPYGGECRYGTMFLVARPDGDNTIMTMDELSEEIGDIFTGQTGTCDLHPIPGTEDLYYTIAEKKPLKRGGRTFYREPAVIFGINEEAGEVVSPAVRQLYEAARYFEEHSTKLKIREGEVSVFCFE